MRIETIELTRINPAPYNPRAELSPDSAEYQAIERSLNRWGLVETLVWNARTGNLVAGHQRLNVLKAHGETSVQCSVVDLSEVEERALNVALNKVDGAWDLPKLSDVLASIAEANVDVRVTGFEPDEITRMLEQASVSAFAPVVDPVIATHTVTDAEVTRENERLTTQFQRERVVTNVVCPHCAHEFAIDGV